MILGAAIVGVFLAWRACTRVEVVNNPPAGSNVIAFGDSLTHGDGASAGRDYPAVLSRLAGVKVINRGRPGDTSADGLARLETDVLQCDPKIVIVFFGGNDLLRRVGEEETFRNLDTIVTRIQQKGAMVVLVGIEAFLFSGNYRSGFRKLAKRRGAVLVPNAMHGIIDHPKMKSDQIHPNDAGYEMIAQRVFEKLKPYL